MSGVVKENSTDKEIADIVDINGESLNDADADAGALLLEEEGEESEKVCKDEEPTSEEKSRKKYKIPEDNEILLENVKKGKIKSKNNGLYLCTRQWIPPGEPVALVFISHGFSDHCARYDDAAQTLASQGILVFGHDHQGHGRSEGDRGNIEDFYTYVHDVCLHIHIMTSIYEGLPLFAWGHAMGACILISIARHFQELFKGLVLTAPLVMPDPMACTPMKRLIAHSIAKFAPKMNLGEVDPSALSRCKNEVRKYKEDPFVYHGGLRLQWATEVMSATMENHAHLDEFITPFIAMHGTHDDCVLPTGTKELYDNCETLDKTLQFYKNWFHELHHEPEQDAKLIVSRISGWILDRLGNSSIRRAACLDNVLSRSSPDFFQQIFRPEEDSKDTATPVPAKLTLTDEDMKGFVVDAAEPTC